MLDKSFWANYIKWSDKNFAKKWYIFISCIFAPVFLLLEILSYKKIWENFILYEIGENEDFCKWLDNNEFGIEKKFGVITRIYKKDVIMPDDEKLSVFKTKELEFLIYKEYQDEFVKRFENNFQIDIENYVSLICDVSLQRIAETKEFMRIYELSLVFYRYDRFIIALRTFKTWLVIIAILIILTVSVLGILGYFR